MLPKSQRHFIPHPSLLPRELPLASFKDTPPPLTGVEGLSGHSWLPELAPFVLPWEAGQHYMMMIQGRWGCCGPG